MVQILLFCLFLFQFEYIFFFEKDIELPDYSQRGQDNYEFLEVSQEHTLSDMDIENLSDDGTLCNFCFFFQSFFKIYNNVLIIKNLDVGVAPPLSDVDSASAIGNFLIYKVCSFVNFKFKLFFHSSNSSFHCNATISCLL